MFDLKLKFKRLSPEKWSERFLISCCTVAGGASTSGTSFAPVWQPSDGWRRMPHHLSAGALWQRIRAEAQKNAVGTLPVLHPCNALHSFNGVMGPRGLYSPLLFCICTLALY